MPKSTPMARAILGEPKALPQPSPDWLGDTWVSGASDCFAADWLGAKPHYADSHVTSPEGWMVWTYLPSGDSCWVADCPTYAEAHALAEALSAPTLWEAQQ